MAETLSLLIVDSDPLRRHALRELLKDNPTVRVEAEAGDAETGYHLLNRLKPSIVLFDLATSPDQAFAVIERLHVAAPQSAIFVSAEGQRADTILRAVRAGAQEFLIRPVSKKELTAAVQRVARQRALAAADAPSKGTQVTMFGCKGGRGTSVIATNLAAALARMSGQRVAAVDLDLYAGDLSLFLNLRPTYTIHDAVTNIDRLDSLFLKNLLAHHPSGVSVLAAPQRVEEADRIEPIKITQLLAVLKASFPYIVVDTGPTYDERNFAALDAADHIVLVVSPEFSSLYHAQRCLELFDRMAYSAAKVKVVLNRCPGGPKKAVKLAEEVLKREVFWELPEDPAVPDSLVTSEPLVLKDTKSRLAEQLSALALRFDGAVSPTAAASPDHKGIRKLFRAKPARVTATQA